MLLALMLSATTRIRVLATFLFLSYVNEQPCSATAELLSTSAVPAEDARFPSKVAAVMLVYVDDSTCACCTLIAPAHDESQLLLAYTSFELDTRPTPMDSNAPALATMLLLLLSWPLLLLSSPDTSAAFRSNKLCIDSTLLLEAAAHLRLFCISTATAPPPRTLAVSDPSPEAAGAGDRNTLQFDMLFPASWTALWATRAAVEKNVLVPIVGTMSSSAAPAVTPLWPLRETAEPRFSFPHAPLPLLLLLPLLLTEASSVSAAVATGST